VIELLAHHPDATASERLRTASQTSTDPTIGARERFEIASAQLHTPWWWVGLHGGAGESTLEQLFVGTRAADHRWPHSDVGDQAIVLVARTHAHGLTRVQSALRELAGSERGLCLLGLVLMADAPGRLPRGLRELGQRVAGVAPHTWWFPWVAAWREGETPSRANAPKPALRLLDQLAAAPEHREAGS
jgi:hypothetical protein